MTGTVEQSQICPHCGTVLMQADWSERAGETQITRLWCCTACGHRSTTTDEGVAPEPSAAELAEEFLPELVVE